MNSIGYELVEKGGQHSFVVRGVEGKILPSMNCPMWFPTKAGAKGCAESLVKKVVEALRQRGITFAKRGYDQ